MNKFQIPVSKPYLGKEELESVQRPLRSGWVTQGPEVEAFESEFARFVGAPYACAVSSCTTGLHLALSVLGIQSGDEVITVSHSFIATANSISYTGALPVFVDIKSDFTFNMDAARIAERITKNTKAILCVHQMGMPCDLGEILAIARNKNLYVIEDAACAIGSEINISGEWEKIGRCHGDIAVFSFHPRKLLTTGDGGMLTSKNPEWIDKAKKLRQHHMSINDSKRHSSSQVIFEDYDAIGFNYRMTDIQASIGREQLKRIPSILDRRRMQVGRYIEAFGGLPTLQLPVEPHWARTNWQSFCISLDKRIDQKKFMQNCLDQGVSTRRGVMCAHRELAYGHLSGQDYPLMNSELAQDHSVILPLFHDLSIEEQDHIIRVVREQCAI